ncbi:hypothetical protein [Lusitaniella coriacea]|uniref:hypothetical protein n=1 Tax=Lusitaniella coriacea TaxID=1983105 RepID=UPI001D153A11|nr:hypothetical protein [Lusitaniella coriacea]
MKYNSLFQICAIATLSVNINLFLSNPTNAQTFRQDPFPDSVAQRVLNQAATDTNFPTSELQITSVDAVTWNNGCMGLGSPSQICTQALVDGWIVSVMSGNNRWIYHASSSRALLANSDRNWRNIGWTQDNPILPQIVESGQWIFEDVPSRHWFDPPTAYGSCYTMLDDSLFTEILDFPIGIDEDNSFKISVDDTTLGEFSPGENVDFISLLGGGVSSFTLTEIDPLIDTEDPSAFPLQLAFNTKTADFKMEALSKPSTVPEPRTMMGLLVLGLIGICSRVKFYRKLD